MQILVLGAGIMGSGIAQLSAMSGHHVVLRDVDPQVLQTSAAATASSLAKLTAKGRLSEEEAAKAIERIVLTTELAGLPDVEIVVEAVPEILELKRAVLAEVVTEVSGEALIGTNTSQLSITSIASALAPESRSRVLGMHFFNPPVLMKLVELIRGLSTSDEALSRAEAFVTSLGRESVICEKDSPGFLTSRVSAILRLECLRMLEEGLASAADIDKAVRLAFNHPMGPLELGDFNGLDTYLHALEALERVHGDRFRPTVGLRNLVEAGRLGRKTGLGIYDHSVTT